MVKDGIFFVSIFGKTNSMKSFYIRLNIIFSTALLLLSGCYAPRYTEVEILYPAKGAFPDDINKVTMVNRSYLPESERSKTGIYYDYSSYEREKNYLDSIVSDNALYSLSYHLNTAPRMDVVKNDTIIHQNVKDYEFLEQMSNKEINRICRETGADAVVALEAFHSFDSLNYYSSGFEVVGVRATSLLTVWRTYAPDRLNAVDSYYDRDTVWFEGVDYSMRSARNNLPNRKEAIQEASYQAGRRYAREISPYWQEIERLYFEYFSKTMSKATEYAIDKKWKKAAAVWRNVANEGDRAKHAIAAYNMAVASEMLGELDMAKYWIEEALKKRPHFQVFKDYNDIIKQRISRQRKINRQLGIAG